ncbi:MAG: tetratricopeptide repeat protein [Pyrinomonadaceae bacterium]
MHRTTNTSPRIIYIAGGTVQAGGGVYVTRKADHDLVNLCRRKAFAYVLTTRQVGKSSLLVNSAEVMKKEGVCTALLDLTKIGVHITEEQWYLGLSALIAEELGFDADVIKWWRARPHLSSAQRFTYFMSEVCLSAVEDDVLIFIDEIDSTLSLPFSDDFYAAIRAIYNARTDTPQFRRLSFVLSGFATPADLIKDPTRTPFNIGEPVELTDFTLDEAEPLAAGLGPSDEPEARQTLGWVLKWTGGHPYLTQRLCRALAEMSQARWTESEIDDVAARTFLDEGCDNDANLSFVRNMLLKSAPEPAKVLTLYRDIYRKEREASEEEQSQASSYLKLSGVVTSERGKLRVRNLIYRQAFNEEWIEEALNLLTPAFGTLSPKYSPQSYIPRPPVAGYVERKDVNGQGIVERIREELAPERNHIVTLLGPGGVGKTTIAAEVARALREGYDERIVWSNAGARAVFTLPELLDDIITQFGMPQLRTLALGPKEAQVRRLIADPPSLIVLDNYETIDPDEQRRIEGWLEHARFSALITSRHRVEQTINLYVPLMSRDEALELLQRLTVQTQSPAVFTKEICERIHEVAEANPFVMGWIVAQIDAAREPEVVLEELQRGEGDAAERIFSRSYNLPQLGDDGRSALMALAIFMPSATRDALASVAGFGYDKNRLNEAVKNLHMLWLIKGVDGNRRLAVEGLTRSLAAAQLAKGERALELRQRFVGYFLAYAQMYSQPTPENLDALEEEKDNLLNAIDVAFETGDWTSLMQIRFALESFLDLRGYWHQAIRSGEQALHAASQLSDEGARAIYARYVGSLYYRQGELDEARRLYSESLAISKRLGDERGIASTLHQLAVFAQSTGELDEARRLYGESLAISKRLGDERGIASTLHQFALLRQQLGELDEARQLYDESLEIKKRVGDQGGQGSTLHQLAMLAQSTGELNEARRLYGESLEIKKRVGDQRGIALTLAQLGRLAESEGDRREAARLYREAVDIFERLGSPYAEKARRDIERVENPD